MHGTQHAMRWPLANLAIALLVMAAFAGGAQAKTTKFWNLTANTITSLQLAPAGSASFGPNLTKSDPDGTVEHDERLKVAVPAGTYDARLADAKGRACTVKGVVVKDGEIFSIDEQQLAGCGK